MDSFMRKLPVVRRSDARWQATIHYRVEDGTTEVKFYLEEIKDLHEIVELGPHWDCVQKIKIFRVNHLQDREMTVEQSFRL